VSENDTVKTPADTSAEFGANEWLVDELWTLYQKDPQLVEKSWWPLFESRAAEAGVSLPEKTAPAPAVPIADDPSPMTSPIAKTTSIAPKEQPIPAEAPTSPTTIVTPVDDAAEEAPSDQVNPLKGMAKALAANMDQSLSVPTATSVRTVPAKLMIDTRR
jgi:2-oxoglutarate decarboxylase